MSCNSDELRARNHLAWGRRRFSGVSSKGSLKETGAAASCRSAEGQLSTACYVPAQPENSCCVTFSPLLSCREIEPLGRQESLLSMLLCGQTSSVAHRARRWRDHSWRLSAPPCQRLSASLTRWHSSGTICPTQVREYSHVCRPEILPGSRESTLHAGRTMAICRSEVPLEGSAATDGPSARPPILLLLVPLHETTCLQNIHVHLGSCFCLQRGKRPFWASAAYTAVRSFTTTFWHTPKTPFIPCPSVGGIMLAHLTATAQMSNGVNMNR